MFDLGDWLAALVVLLGAATLTWIASVVQRNVTIVDVLWSLLFLIAALVYVERQPIVAPRAVLVVVLTGLWALRLATYLHFRSHGKPEDRRYQAIRARNQPGFEWKSLYLVFWLQAGLAWVISLPLLGAARSLEPLGWLDAAGVLLWLVGMVFEAGGDWQLTRFKADPANAGKVMDRGLWRYTRHPNYFGNCCIWWGLYLVALGAGAWWSIVGPLLMTVLLLKVSGVSLLERDIGERRPGYAEYVRRTPAFLPGRPRP